MCLLLGGVAATSACDTECDKALRDLSACCTKYRPDGGECDKLNQQTFIDTRYLPDAGPDASYDAGMVTELTCEGGWLDYARSVLKKGLDPSTCTVKP